MDKIIEEAIAILQSGKQLPEEYLTTLFPVNHAEYELTYKGKVPKEQILSVGEEPQGVPFQIAKTFGEKENANDWQNFLIFGDNFQVLKTLHENIDPLIYNKIKGKVKLIYIDPPFATSDDFSSKDGAKAYSDKIKGAEFIEFLRERLVLAKEVLADDGSIFVHLDAKMGHYIKIIMDEIFNSFEFSEIIWVCGLMGSGDFFPKAHETIYCYRAKSASFTVQNRLGLSTRITGALQRDENGWYYTRGRESSGGMKALKTYICPDNLATKEMAINYANRERKQPVWSVWIGKKEIAEVYNDFPVGTYAYTKQDSTGYPTQKPEELLKRIILTSTKEDDLVMDFFAGSGTTLAVAERLNRRWIGVDIGKLAIYTIQKRLINLPHRKPFALVNAGCYDLKKIFEMERQKYIDFVCELFHIDKKSSKLNGITVDGTRRGDWVKIYEWQEFDKTHTAVDEAFINELHRNIGDKLKEKFYIVAPEVNVDIVGDYYRPDGSNTKYYLLKIPYRYIQDLHKMEFKKLHQPTSKSGINSIENAVGFYFNDMPEVKSRIETIDMAIVLHIDECKPQFIQDDNDILAMVLIDSSDGNEFVMQKAFFADDILDKTTGKHSLTIPTKELNSNNLKVVYIDKYGNEFFEVLKGVK
ncbi:MAG: site-specific DNA-methyltransferase [Clostridiales bacterium]|jgi:site-specific DNA-methyltransferase (adenine-specific)/adenine-specific DNA-methyltransferase|nr:site-specific DNA-methyltransferase [Clostridiales bacterium]